MKARNIAMMFLMALLILDTTLYAESESTDNRAYLGVRLDPEPLPNLLVKHLGLTPNEGIRVRNVRLNSPADKAGLERDDIIIGYKDKKVTSGREFFYAVRESEVDKEVPLEIIHLGKRKTVKLKLESIEGESVWKYPLELEVVKIWRPGKIFRLKAGSDDWMEIPLHDVTGSAELYLKEIFKDGFPELPKEMYQFRYSDGNETCTITVEGDPSNKDAEITVGIGQVEYTTTVKEIDELPKKYRTVAKMALDDARKTIKQRKDESMSRAEKFYMPSPQESKVWRYLKDDEEDVVGHRAEPPSGSDDEMLERIKKQMRELQLRIDELEERHKEKQELSPDKPGKQKSQEQEKINQNKI